LTKYSLVGASASMGPKVEDLIGSYDPNRPLATASTPPSSWYTESSVFELEQPTVFSHSWQFIGRSEQVLDTGQYISCEIAGEPILAVRGSDNVLRGFFNVCRHHAAAVVTQAEGNAQTLRCPYHGWTYNLQGALILTPEFGGVANFDRAPNGLVPVQIGVWNRWVFAKLNSEVLSLEDFLGSDLLERFKGLNVEPLKWFERRRYMLDCNWKVFVDNYLDGGYHVPHIHGALNSALDYTNYSIETGARFCLQSSPIANEKAETNVSAVRQGKRADYFWIYPNFMINVYEGVMDTNLVIPRGVDRTEVIFDYYFADISPEAREKILASIRLSEQIQAEDVAICESVQRGLRSRSYSAGRLSVRREAGEHLFHKLLYADLKAALTADVAPQLD
jgi:phenylpropionate dioxygenase-like ring-hydroxylating dioxygenase large terminal subunit